MTRQRWKSGAVLTISLANGWHGYAQMLEQPEYAFFAIRTNEEVSPEAVVASAVLFRLWVMNAAHAKSRWGIVGRAAVAEALRDPVPRFNQDPLEPGRVIVKAGSVERPGMPAECRALERAAVWDPEHVEDRLNDHFAGRANRWVESLRVKL